MENELPEGWVLGRVIDLFDVNPGHKGINILDSCEVTFLPMPLIKEEVNVIDPSLHKEYKQVKNGFTKFIEDDVLFAKITPCMENGKIAIAQNLFNKIGCGTTELHVLRPKIVETNKYLFYFLIQERFRAFAKSKFQGAVGHLRVPSSIFSEFIYPLPPLAEQRRIVAKLDEAFGHLETLKSSLARIPELLKKFRQTVLTQAVTGKLTEGWRGNDALIDWETTLLKSITERITDGDHQAPPKAASGIPFIVISDVSKGKLNLLNVKKFVPEEYYNSISEYRRPRKNDVLYTVTGSIGIPILVETNDLFCFQRHIGLIRPDPAKINCYFLYYLLGSAQIFQQAKDVATGTAQLTIPLNGIRSFIISLPPLAEQEEIVRRVEGLFGVADRLEAQYAALRERIEALPGALLAKAFRGELVAQDPADEPATALLARIKADTATTLKAARKLTPAQTELIFTTP